MLRGCFFDGLTTENKEKHGENNRCVNFVVKVLNIKWLLGYIAEIKTEIDLYLLNILTEYGLHYTLAPKEL